MLENQGKCMRILLCTTGYQIDASTAIFLHVFQRIPGCTVDTMKPPKDFSDWQALEKYQLVVSVREIRGIYGQILREAKKRRIKTAYATDDNLHELAKVYPLYVNFNYPEYLELLRSQDYVFCTNMNLCQYYADLTAGKIVCIPVNVPVEDIPVENNPVHERRIIGYFGNARPILSDISEAIKRVMKKCPDIIFYSAGADLREYGVDCTYISFNLDFRQALDSMKRLCPHILLAPNSLMISETLRNTNMRYKNIVKLLDATRCGAVLTASRMGPFESLDVSHGVLTIGNRIEDWYDALFDLSENPDRRRELFLKARAFIIENHETSKIASRIEKELN